MFDPNIYISCWILGDEPERRFSVHISPEATVDGLKDVIKEKKRVAFDGIDANTLDLYSISVARDDLQMELKNINLKSFKNKRLWWADKLSQVFPDPPTDGHLHIIVIHPLDTVHHPLETGLYEVFKHQKVVTMAPSELAKSSTYEPMQKSSICFGHFLDIMDGGTDIPGLNLVDIQKLQAEVDELTCRMCYCYDHKDTQRDAAHPILNRIFAAHSGVEIPPIHMDTIGSVKSDGHVMWENGVVTLATRFKNQVPGNNHNGMPDVELVGYIAHLHAKKMKDDEELFWGWRVPCLGLTFVGSDIKFYAIILIGIQYRLVSLTPALSCIPHVLDGQDRQALYTAFTAASVLQAHIQGDVNRYLAVKPPAIQKNTYHFPAISKLRIYGSLTLGYLKFEILQRHDDLSTRWLYFAETGGPDSQTILIKFVQHYSVDLHAFFLAYEKLPGGWHAVAMEYISNGVLITDSPLLTTCRDKWTEELKTLVQSFHDNGFVHGDLRNPNIICDDKGSVFLIDFDWSGKEGDAFYPTRKLNQELLEGRTSLDLKITRGDDDRVLCKTLDKLKKTNTGVFEKNGTLLPSTLWVAAAGEGDGVGNGDSDGDDRGDGWRPLENYGNQGRKAGGRADRQNHGSHFERQGVAFEENRTDYDQHAIDKEQMSDTRFEDIKEKI
ncbi:hypothetical protein BGW80DRAFT_1441969 [Lactifluus volemus]|nr:hypothetical protein BGW80DRAFT_1441969 [Lactifluus volemus]